MPKFTLLTPRDLECIAEAFVARDPAAPLSKPAALNTIARTLTGTRADWGRIKNHAEDTLVSQRAAAAQAAAQPAPSPSSTLLSPRVADGGTIPATVGVVHDGGFPSGVATQPRAPDAALDIQAAPTLLLDTAITACRAPNLDDLCAHLTAHPYGRPFTAAPVLVDCLSPREIKGCPLPLVFHAHTPQPRHQGLADLDFDTLPVLGFLEDAWSETLKAVDDALGARFQRWHWTAHSAKRKGHTTPPPPPPLAVLFVRNSDRFHDLVHRYMPFVRSALMPQ